MPDVRNEQDRYGLFIPFPLGGDTIDLDPDTRSEILRDAKEPDNDERNFEKFNKLMVDSEASLLYLGCKHMNTHFASYNDRALRESLPIGP